MVVDLVGKHIMLVPLLDRKLKDGAVCCYCPMQGRHHWKANLMMMMLTLFDLKKKRRELFF